MTNRCSFCDIVLVVFLTFFGDDVFGIEDYCSLNTYATNGTYMQFTKEPSVEEFAVAGKFKGLHCCAKGYRSIEWYKDGNPYPWPGTTSQLILYPESANQTVYTQTVTTEDAGNYTCLLRNDSVVRTHTIQLKVFEKVPDDPKITYVSDDADAKVGQPIRLFCEAFVGLVDLPDAYNEAIWWKEGHNGTIEDNSRFRQEKTSREDGQTFGTYLIIDNVLPEDYGKYVCRISKPGKTISLPVHIREKIEVEYLRHNPMPWKKMLLWALIIALVVSTIVVLKVQYGLLLRVQFKDSFGAVEENDGKSNDVLIVYSQKDSEIALGVLLPTLESKHGYKCGARELPENLDTWHSDLSESARKSRRMLALISPSSLADKWDKTTLYHAIKQLQSFGPHVTFIMLAKIPQQGTEIKNSQGETLSSVLRNVSVIHWRNHKDDKFWLSLRLRLPPKLVQQSHLENINLTQGENSTRLTRDSHESLDNFV